MMNNTIKSYKNAIKEKYELVKNGDNYRYLLKPSQANLRKLCWESFENNSNQNDLLVFKTFFGFAFDLTQKNTFKTKTERFKPIGSFFRGETISPTDDIIELAAILVDFQPRPFNKFRTVSGRMEKEEENVAGDEIKNSLDIRFDDKLNGNEVEVKKEIIKPLKPFLDFKNSSFEELFKKSKLITIVLLLFLAVGFGISYYLFPKKQCMQWSSDHYETVNCDRDIKAFGTYNVIEPLDKSLLNLRKIKVCDTTKFFKNNVAIVWYAKTQNGIEFFNTHGRHPENNHALKPITPYIIKKYVKKELK